MSPSCCPGSPLPRVRGPLDRQIAECLGRSPTVKAYFYDPTGEKARAVKARYVGVCRGCGACTQPRSGKGDAYAYCEAGRPGAIERRGTRERVLAAMTEWRSRYGTFAVVLRLVARARRSAWGRGAQATRQGEWPRVERGHPALRHLDCCRAAASRPNVAVPTPRSSAMSRLGSNSISLPNPRESTAISEDLGGGGAEPRHCDLQDRPGFRP
jgi:hypothetical protein